MSIGDKEYQNPDSKCSSLTIVDGLIFRLVCGSTEQSPRFALGRTLPHWCNANVCRMLGCRRVSQEEWTIEGKMVISALYFARSTYEVFNDCLVKFFNFPLDAQLYLFIVAKDWEPVKFVKNAKFFTAWPIARYNGQGGEVPVPEDFKGANGLHPLIFKGGIRKMLKQRLVSHNKNNLHLWGSFLQGIKRGCYTVPESFIQDSYVKHRNQMLMKPETNSFQIHSKYETYVERALEQCAPIKQYKLFEGSTSACFEKKRDEGGARETIKEFLSDIGDWIEPEELMKFYDLDQETIKIIYNTPSLLAQVKYRYEMEVATAVYDLIDDKEHLDVMVHGICEPLKVRNITKGEAIPYWIARHAQKEMWGFLQNYPQFSATGRPLESSDIYAIQQRMRALEQKKGIKLEFDKWVSGDYSAATDGVNIHMTMMVFEQFMKQLAIPDHIVRVIRKVIGPQKIHYPPKSHLAPVIQQNGQLMGSVLSFPILCIINIIAYWCAMEEYISELTEDNIIDMIDLPVMVNGDDILFPANDYFYEFWKKNVAIVGFKLSLGKNYISDLFLTINSVLYQVKHNGSKYEDAEFEEVPVYNVGLLTGQSKHTARNETRTLPIWTYYNEVIKGAARKSNARARFFHYNKKWIDECTCQGLFNCYLPHELGGLGFVVDGLDQSRLHITYFQKLWADYCIENGWKALRDTRDTQVGIIRIRDYKPSLSSKITDERGEEISPLNSLISQSYPYLRPKSIYGPDLPYLVRYKDLLHIYEPSTELLWGKLDYENKPRMTIRIPWKTVNLIKANGYHPKQRVSYKSLMEKYDKELYYILPLANDYNYYSHYHYQDVVRSNTLGEGMIDLE